MRYSILGFQQEKLLEYDLSMNEVLILDYIYNAQASPSMLHKIKDDATYTWICHDKLMEDLPILNIKEDRLKQIIKRLVDIGLLQRTTTRNALTGSKAYYGITLACEDMRYYDPDEHRGVKNYTSRGVKNYTSDSQLSNKQTILSKDSIVGETKSCQTETTTKKPNLFQKCIALSEEYTENETLRKYLADFLKICLENSREAGRPFYANMWKSKLTKLSELSDNDDMQIKIVKQTLDNGWSNFYAYKESGRAGRQTGDFAKDVEHLSAGLNSRAERRDTSGEKF